MRTYLTRLTMAAAGAVLTGASLAGVAHAGEGGDEMFVASSVLEHLELEPCDEISASEDMRLPVDPNWEPDGFVPTEPDDPDDPGKPWGEFDLVPCLQIPDGDEDDGNGGDGDDNGGDGDDNGGDGDDNGGGNEPGGGGNGGGAGNGGGDNSGGAGNGGGTSDDQGSSEPKDRPDDGSSGDANDGTSDEDADESSDDQTPRQDDVTPTAAAGGGGNATLMLAVLAGVLGTAGLLLLVYGLRKRPRRGYQPAR